MHSDIGPNPTHAIWALCWGLSLHARSPSHPPLFMLQDLHVPRYQGIDKSASAALDSDRIRLAAVIVGLGDSLLCLGLWPGAAQSTAHLAGNCMSQSAWLPGDRIRNTAWTALTFAASRQPCAVCMCFMTGYVRKHGELWLWVDCMRT